MRIKNIHTQKDTTDIVMEVIPTDEKIWKNYYKRLNWVHIYCCFYCCFNAFDKIGFNTLNLIHTYKYASILILVLPVEQAFFTACISTALYFFDYKKAIICSDKLILIRRFHKQITVDKEQILISKKYIIVKLSNLTTNKNWYFICCKFSSKNYQLIFEKSNINDTKDYWIRCVPIQLR